MGQQNGNDEPGPFVGSPIQGARRNLLISRKYELEESLCAFGMEGIDSNSDHIKMCSIEILHSASPAWLL